MAAPTLPISNFNVLKQYVDRKFIRTSEQYAAGFNTNAISEATPGSGVTIDSPLTATAGFTVIGNETYIQTMDVVISDPNIFINFGNIIPGYVRTGILTNIESTNLYDTFTQLNSDLTIITDGSATFTTNDIVTITNTLNNNGVYEVDTHIGNILTVRGILGTPNVEVFTRDTITTETAIGIITKIVVSHLSANSSGGWEYATGSTTGLSYSGVGSDTITLQNVYDNGEQIILNTDGILIKDNIAPVSGNILDIKNNTETVSYFNVSSSGVSANILDINSNVSISAGNDSLFNITQSPVATIGQKLFTLTSNTSDNSVVFQIANQNSSASGHSGIHIQTDKAACTGNGGNQYISYDSCVVGGWTVGRQKSTNTFRWNYYASNTLSLTDDINTKMYLDTSGNLRTTGNGTFNNIVLQNVPNDNTETNLLAWNATSKTIEYRTVASLPVVNPFDQLLNKSNNVEFNIVDIASHMQISASEFSSLFTFDTPTNLGSKTFSFKANSNDNAVILSVENANSAAAAHAILSVQTDKNGGSGAGGNAVASFQNVGSNTWTIGKKSSDGLFRFNVSANTDYLTLNTNTKLSIDQSGNVVAAGGITCSTVNTGQGANSLYFMDQPVGSTSNVTFNQVGLNAGHTILSAVTDGVTNIEQFPLTTVSNRLFTFKTDSQSSAYISISNKNTASTAHAGVRIETDTFAGGTGGNQFVAFVNHTANPWSVGRKLSDNTIRFNLATSPTIDPLTTDLNTKMKLDSVGKLTISSLSVNSDNFIITSSNDSDVELSQNPAITTGEKLFTFTSNTTDDSVILQTVNAGVSATAHVSNQLYGLGNRAILFEKSGISKWEMGAQSTTDTFRWNFGIGYDYLTNNSFTKMYLDSSGNLNVISSYNVNGNKVVGARLAGVPDASAANAFTLTNITSGITDGIVINTSASVTGVDGTGNNAASKADVDSRLVDINNNIAELTVNQNSMINDIASIRTALNTLLSRVRATTGHGLIA